MSDNKPAVGEPIFTHELRRAIPNAEGVDTTSLTFREPRAGDIMRCGNPVKYQPFGDEREIAFDEAKMTRMLAALSGIPQPMIERMTTQDWTECAWGIARFFVPWLSRT